MPEDRSGPIPIGGPVPSGRPVPIGGTVDPAFVGVRDAFIENWNPADGDPGELGAALCVVLDGQVVVDLWGGWTSTTKTRPWEPDTLVNAYSVGKAVTTATVLAMVARGELALDEPVCAHWPEFAEHGKAGVTLRDALAHRAGVPGARQALSARDAMDFEAVAAALAASEPWWEPGSAHGYHVNTLGHLVGEPVRRVTGRRFGTAVADLVAGPCEADLWIGLPESLHHRVADVDFHQHIPEEFLPHRGDDLLSRMRRAAYFNPPELSGLGSVNTAAFRSAEIPSTNLHASARGVATMFAALAGAPHAGTELAIPRSLIGEATTTHSLGEDLVLERRSHFGLGFMLPDEARPIGVGPSSFGHFGNGGSLGFADLDARMGFGYVLNRPGDRWQVQRTRRLLAALLEALSPN